jgi:pimeloyl-ACP methyl ester carboxylesterase
MRPSEIALEAHGVRLRGIAWPGPASPLSLLLHATSFCAEVWLPAWEAAQSAASRALRAVAVDARGHGRSGRAEGEGAYAWTRGVEDVIAWLEALAPEAEGGTLLAGHSSGGTLALAAAALRPELVRGVALIEPVLFDVPSDAAREDSFLGSRLLAERARKRRAEFAGMREARERLLQRFPYAGFASAAFEAFLAGGVAGIPGGGVRLRCAPEVEAAWYEGAAALDVWPLLGKVRAPVLLLQAEHGAMPAALVERLRGALPALRLERVPGTTHFAALEAPERVGALLGAFAASLAGAST